MGRKRTKTTDVQRARILLKHAITDHKKVVAAAHAAGVKEGERREREACAKLADDIYSWPGAYKAGNLSTNTLKTVASAIRAREIGGKE